jgi:hypothetical protein
MRKKSHLVAQDCVKQQLSHNYDFEFNAMSRTSPSSSSSSGILQHLGSLHQNYKEAQEIPSHLVTSHFPGLEEVAY